MAANRAQGPSALPRSGAILAETGCESAKGVGAHVSVGPGNNLRDAHTHVTAHGNVAASRRTCTFCQKTGVGVEWVSGTACWLGRSVISEPTNPRSGAGVAPFMNPDRVDLLRKKDARDAAELA